MELNISQMTDDELRQQLRIYGVNVGPVVASTRLFYEKKLAHLKEFGCNPPMNQSESEESDYEDEVQHSGGDENTYVNEYDAVKPLVSSKLADTSQYTKQETRSYVPIVQPRTASPTRAALRRNLPEPSDSKKYIQHTGGESGRESAHNGGISLWLKLIFIFVLVALVYLVIININPSAENKIPEEV